MAKKSRNRFNSFNREDSNGMNPQEDVLETEVEGKVISDDEVSSVEFIAQEDTNEADINDIIPVINNSDDAITENIDIEEKEPVNEVNVNEVNKVTKKEVNTHIVRPANRPMKTTHHSYETETAKSTQTASAVQSKPKPKTREEVKEEILNRSVTPKPVKTFDKVVKPNRYQVVFCKNPTPLQFNKITNQLKKIHEFYEIKDNGSIIGRSFTTNNSAIAEKKRLAGKGLRPTIEIV